MKETYKLFMVMLGCTPKGRLTEQHDIFFGVGTSVQELVKDMYAFWPDGGELHVDAWREVTHVDGFDITIEGRETAVTTDNHLFFINLGGYKHGEFEEYHYRALAVGGTMSKAIRKSKTTAFYKHCGFKGAESHIDEKYGVDVDDTHKVQDILAPHVKNKFSLVITPADHGRDDELHIGYLKLGKRK